ncbi:putative alpha-1,2-mannosidase [Pedobacter sp. UYEF25]
MLVNRFNLSILAIALLGSSCKTLRTTKGKQTGGYTRYVNTFIGTAPLLDPKIIGYTPPKDWRVWAGLTFPGSSLPNAMVQLSPITKFGSGAGYEYEDSVILGFAHTNKGHWNLCNIPILPVSGAVDGTNKFSSHFSHKNESSSPAFYQVFLDDYKVNVSLTSTLRCGYHKYEYQNNKNRQIFLDLNKANSGIKSWMIEQVGDRNLSGYQDMGSEKVYFYIDLNNDVSNLFQSPGKKSNSYAMVTLKDGASTPVELKIGLSFVSVANAKENLEVEIGNKSFAQIRAAGNATWEQLLSRVQVKGGNNKQREMFYSSLYRSFLWPALRSDINGEYTDEKQHKIKANFNYYTVPSLWDTYRNKLVLLGMLQPKTAEDVIKSLMDMGDKTGYIPTFFHGDHAASFITGSYLKGITNFDVKHAYDLLLKSANDEGGPRPFIKEYIEKGYISTPDIAHPNTETKAKAGVSKTLEFSYDDYSVAQLAKVLGDSSNYRTFMKRSKNYQNVFDKETKFMRGRLSNGDFVKNFDAEYPYYEYMFREANAWQVSFYAVHDMPGLVNLYGGKQAFENKLDTFFTKPWNPKHIARNVSTFIGQYCQGNQPDHEAPFAYYFVDKPEKSQKILDYIINNLYGIGKEGLALSGMDDAGEMSSWYVFSAMGLYPLSPTDAHFITTVPVFDQIDWTTNNGKKLIIKKEGIGRKLTEVDVNGKRLNGYFISNDLFKNGGNIEIKTKE